MDTPKTLKTRAGIRFAAGVFQLNRTPLSTFKNEAKDFNEDSIPKVARNVTKLSEIKKALGEPTGRSIYPDTDYPDQRAYLYQYLQVERGSSLVKTAVFFTDLDETITDYRFSASTENR